MTRLPGFTLARRVSVGSELHEQRERDRSERATLVRTRGRQAIIFALMALVLVGLGARTAYWQIWQQAALAARADAEHLRAFAVPAGRGTILDANGTQLALSVTEDAVIADPDIIREVHALDATARTLASALGLPLSLVRGELDVPGAYVMLRDASGRRVLLTVAQSTAINGEIANGNLAGVALYPQVRRIYPDGTLAAQVLGFVRTSDGMGQYGVEQQYQSVLAGKPGKLYTAVDANGDPLATTPQRQTPAVPGANITLTIDANVQYWAEQGLAQTVRQSNADGGTVIVMDPHTGAIIAMATLPSFDPNTYGQAPLANFVNPAVSSLYDPGSVMKGITMASALDAGAITPDTAFEDTGVITVDGITIHNWDHLSHGMESMTKVLQNSANVGAVWAAERIGVARFNHYLTAFGFGHLTGIDLPVESAGLRPQSPSLGEAELTMAENSFGESIGVTPMQMVAAYGALANHGLLMRPYIVSSVAADGGAGRVTHYGPHAVRQVISPTAAQDVTQMLVNSALHSDALMYKVAGYQIAAKTGTSTPDPANPNITYASILGYAPASNPRFVMLVKLDHPRTDIFGGSVAGPLWQRLAEQMFVYYHIPPDAPATRPAGA